MSETINILLVDDEPRNIEALEAILDDPTYNLLKANDAERALRLLLEHDVAAIVLDIKMPGVSGFELAQLIKGTKRFRQIPLVFLTAYLVDDADIITGYGAGAVDYLTKPVNPQILRHKVAVFADLFRKTRALAELNEHLEARVQERTAELEQSEGALRQANKQKDLFLATLAHELRNPLAPLRTGLDLLLGQPGQSETATRTLAAMNRQLDHMVRLVDDLLDVSRISRGTLEMRKERAELAAIIERAVETVRPAFTRRQQTVAVVADVPVTAHVDATRIVQVVGNLLSNSSKHSPPGAQIEVRLQCDGPTASIQVIDNGLGIPADQIERVFQMFTKIERAAPALNDGLGIGLALSLQLATLHGGTLTAASMGEGKGATFTLSVPITNHEDVTVASAETSVKALTPAAAPPSLNENARLRIVVVEDNEDAADTMSEWLQHLGHDVQVARTGPDGVALVLAQRPDVVLCDIGLPGMDGVDVCRDIVRGMQVPPVMIALTGWGMESDRKRTMDAGFKHHLVKPVAPEKLRTVLQSVERVARSE
jgi:signal transduction histidine kinase